MLHMTIPFKEKPKSNLPGDNLRYYRLRKQLTTRQLAEQIDVVPATILMYEQNRHPICIWNPRDKCVSSSPHDTEEDCYYCAENRKLPLRRDCTQLVDGRWQTEAWYRCESCSDCPRRAQCCRAKDLEQAKTLHVKKDFWEPRAQAMENITSPRGIHLRQCRSIQAEGTFALLKNDFGFRRFLTRGRANVRTEMFLLALAFDPKKYWLKRENGRLQTRVSEKITA